MEWRKKGVIFSFFFIGSKKTLCQKGLGLLQILFSVLIFFEEFSEYKNGFLSVFFPSLRKQNPAQRRVDVTRERIPDDPPFVDIRIFRGKLKAARVAVQRQGLRW